MVVFPWQFLGFFSLHTTFSWVLYCVICGVSTHNYWDKLQCLPIPQTNDCTFRENSSTEDSLQLSFFLVRYKVAHGLAQVYLADSNLSPDSCLSTTEWCFTYDWLLIFLAHSPRIDCSILSDLLIEHVSIQSCSFSLLRSFEVVSLEAHHFIHLQVAINTTKQPM